MIRRWMGAAGGLALIAACAGAPETAGEPMDSTAETATPAVSRVALACEPSERMPVEGRASAYDSAAVAVGGSEAKVCYGRPVARGRTIFGGLVPYDTLWRTGANEPTIIHLPVAARIAGVEVQPGSYSLYTVPGRESWTVVVNRATSQWGHESSYTPEVRAQEVGRATVPAETIASPVENFTIRGEPGAAGSDLVVEWERTRVRIPIQPA